MKRQTMSMQDHIEFASKINDLKTTTESILDANCCQKLYARETDSLLKILNSIDDVIATFEDKMFCEHKRTLDDLDRHVPRASLEIYYP